MGLAWVNPRRRHSSSDNSFCLNSDRSKTASPPSIVYSSPVPSVSGRAVGHLPVRLLATPCIWKASLNGLASKPNNADRTVLIKLTLASLERRQLNSWPIEREPDSRNLLVGWWLFCGTENHRLYTADGDLGCLSLFHYCTWHFLKVFWVSPKIEFTIEIDFVFRPVHPGKIQMSSFPQWVPSATLIFRRIFYLRSVNISVHGES